MALLEDAYETTTPSIIFDINQIDTSLNHMLSKLRVELEQFETLPNAEMSEEDLVKYEKLERDINEAKEILKEKLETFASSKEQLSKLENASALIRNLVAALQFALERISSMVSAYADANENTMLDAQIKSLEANIISIETLINKTFDGKKEKLQLSLETCTRVIRNLYKSYQSIKEVSLIHLCPICLQNSVASFLIPCGHTYCDKCIKKIGRSCFICRQEVQRFSQLYFN